MHALGLAFLHGLDRPAPPALRARVGVGFTLHGWQKLPGGPDGFALLAGLVALLLLGPGPLSLDHALGVDRTGVRDDRLTAPVG